MACSIWPICHIPGYILVAMTTGHIMEHEWLRTPLLLSVYDYYEPCMLESSRKNLANHFRLFAWHRVEDGGSLMGTWQPELYRVLHNHTVPINLTSTGPILTLTMHNTKLLYITKVTNVAIIMLCTHTLAVCHYAHAAHTSQSFVFHGTTLCTAVYGIARGRWA